MIFAIIGEELGLVGATALIAAYATFAYVGLRIALALPGSVRQGGSRPASPCSSAARRRSTSPP